MAKSYAVTRLDNGLRVATTNMPNMKSVAVGVWFGCGSRYENTRINGISHLIEHFVFKGTRKRPGDEICETIEGVGGEINASTSEESTVYYVKAMREELSLAIDILLDMVINPVLQKDLLPRQRDIVVEEIHMHEDRPSSYTGILFNRLIWGSHPLGFHVLGTIESMGKITHEEIVKYRRRMYCSNKCVVAAAGDIDHEDFVRLVAKYSRNLRRGRVLNFKPLRLRQTKPRLLVERRDTEQVHLLLGVRALSWNHRGKYALKLISTILGENMSSRLFRSVREERGYAYSINTGIDRFIDTGAFYVEAGILTEKIRPAIRLVLREMGRLTRVKVTKEELERAKESVRGSLVMASEQTISRMYWLGDSLRMADRISEIETTVNAVMDVSVEEVRNLARRLFRQDRLNLALIGNIDSESTIEKCLRSP
jgi:predicted Zn-dependent peptidase